MFPRPTLRCLEEDLGMKIPLLTESLLHNLDLPVLQTAQKELQRNATQRQSLSAIDDNYLIRLRHSRMRGVMYISVNDPAEAWVVASAIRKEGSGEDPYKKIQTTSENNLKLRRANDSSYKKGKKTDSSYLLPTKRDYSRLNVEKKLDRESRITQSVQDEISKAIFTKGEVFSNSVEGYTFEVLITTEEIPELHIGLISARGTDLDSQITVLAAARDFIDPCEIDYIALIEGGEINSSISGHFCYMGILKPYVGDE